MTIWWVIRDTSNNYVINTYPSDGSVAIQDNRVKLVHQTSDYYVAVGAVMVISELPIRLSLSFQANHEACGYGIMAVSENNNSIGGLVYLDKDTIQMVFMDGNSTLNALVSKTIDIYDTLVYTVQLTIDKDKLSMNLNDDNGVSLFNIESAYQDTVVFDSLSINTYQNPGVIVYFDDLIVENEDSGSSIELTNSMSDYAIYPNPTQGIVNISNFREVSSISIYSISGCLIDNVDLVSGNGIDLSSYKKGIYMLKISSEDGTYFKKLIKE